jgi:7,8-dihydroneopterin aldolase/epimerase/oxygenase
VWIGLRNLHQNVLKSQALFLGRKRLSLTWARNYNTRVMSVKNFFQHKSDSIFIDRCEVLCKVGHTKNERSFPQIIELSVEILSSLEKAGRSDRMQDTVDYARIILQIKTALKKRSFTLIEAVAETVARLILSHPRVEGVKVKAAKKVFEGIAAVGVTIHRAKARA